MLIHVNCSRQVSVFQRKDKETWKKKEIWSSVFLFITRVLTTVFLDTRLSKSKHPLKRFQNFRQSCVLSTDRIEIHQSQPLVWPSDLLYVMLAGCDWWISIRSVDNMHDWRKFWKRFRGCFVFESRVSTKTVVIKKGRKKREKKMNKRAGKQTT